MNTFKALIKREFWEHKGSFFYAPAIMVAVFALVMILGGLSGDAIIIDGQHSISFSDKLPKVVESFEQMPEEIRDKGVQMFLFSPVALFGFVMFVISIFYCLGSLYDERKDRSILFWKSLPISDTETVLSKFVAVSLLVPVLYFAVVVVFQLFLLLYVTVGSWFGGSSGVTIWASSNLFSVWFNSLLALIAGTLWLAPIWAWLILSSSWAKKVPFLWAGLPILMIIIAEGWVFRTHRFAEMVGDRFAQGFGIQNHNLHHIAGGDMFDFAVNSPFQSFATLEFWVGAAVAAVFLAGAVYVRRFRDES